MFENMTPEQAFLLAYGSGLMGTRGSAGFGRAGMMGLQAADSAKRTQLLASEDARRQADSKMSRELHELQKQQIQSALEDDRRNREIYAQIAKRFAGGGGAPPSAPPVPAMPAGPLNPDMSPLDAAMLARNHVQAAAGAPQPDSTGRPFPFSYDEVMAAKYATRGKVDLTGDYKDSMKTEEVKPGTIQRDIRGNERFVDVFDVERGAMGNPTTGLRPIPGSQQIATDRTLATSRAQEQAKAERDMITVVDPRPGAPSYGKSVLVPRATYQAWVEQLLGGGQPASLPEPTPTPVAQISPVRPGPSQPPQPPAQARPPAMTAPGAGTGNPADRIRLLQEELQREQAKLRELESTPPASLKLKYGTNFDPAAELERTRANLASVQRELAPAAAQAGPQAAAPPGVGRSPVPGQTAPPAAPLAPAAPSAPGQKELDFARNKTEARFNEAYNNMLRVQYAAKEIAQGANSLTTGAIGVRMAKVEGTQAFALRMQLDSLRGRLFADALQTMRELAPTGGAVGNVAVAEMETLKNSITAIDQGMDETSLRKAIGRAAGEYDRIIKRLQEAFAQDYGQPPSLYEVNRQGTQTAGPEPIDNIIKRNLQRGRR